MFRGEAQCDRSEPLGIHFRSLPELIFSDGRIFAPYVAGGAGPGSAPVAAFALSREGAGRLRVSQATLGGPADYACRDGKLDMSCDGKLRVPDASDGAVVAEVAHGGPFLLWGDRIVAQVGNRTHESIGHHAHLQALTGDTDGLRLSGHRLTPCCFAHPDGNYKGVSGYIMWMRSASVDGFLFDRVVNQDTGKGATVCWDLRARPQNALRAFRASGPWQGLERSVNDSQRIDVEFDGSRLEQVPMVVPGRQWTGEVMQFVVRGTPVDEGTVRDGRWQGELLVDCRYDVERWHLELATDPQEGGTWRRVIPQLEGFEEVEGAAHAHRQAEDDTVRWSIHLPRVLSREPAAPADDRRQLYLVVEPSGDQTVGWSRAPRLNAATHELLVTRFEAGRTTLERDAIVLMHSDRHLNPTAPHIGTAAVQVNVSLKLEGDPWRGTCAVRQGIGWTVEGELEFAPEAAQGPPEDNRTGMDDRGRRLRCLAIHRTTPG